MSAPHTFTRHSLGEGRDTSARDFLAALKYRYHHYEHCASAVETEIREILAGRRKQLTRLRRLQNNCSASCEAFTMYLARITSAVKTGSDPRLIELLDEKFGRLNDSVYVPLDTENE